MLISFDWAWLSAIAPSMDVCVWGAVSSTSTPSFTAEVLASSRLSVVTTLVVTVVFPSSLTETTCFSEWSTVVAGSAAVSVSTEALSGVSVAAEV